MGLYFEDKLIRPKSDGDEVEKLIHQGYKEVDELFAKNNNVIILKRDFAEHWDTKKQSKKPAPPIALPVEKPIYLDSLGSISVKYSKEPPQRQGDSVTYPSNRLLVYEKLMLTRKDKDLAWYLLKASNFVIEDGSESIAAFLRIEDPKAEVRKKAGEIKLIAQVDAYLLRDDSPLFNQKAMQMIADRFGFELENDDLEIVAYELRQNIIAAHESKNPDVNVPNFIKFAKKLEANLSGGKPKKEEKKEAKVEDENKEPSGTYNQEQLGAMTQQERNVVAEKFGIRKSPPATKIEQIGEILDKQKNLEPA